MRPMTGSDVERAAADMVSVLGPRTGADWRVPAGSLDWTCWTTAAHVAHDLLAYAAQVAAEPSDAYLPLDLRVREDASPGEVLGVVSAAARLLSTTVDAAPGSARAWHWGPCDPGGFAAMGVAEILLHTHDITRGLALRWLPPAGLSALVLARLFPDSPSGPAPQVLLWSAGRLALPDRPRRTSWSWRAALAPSATPAATTTAAAAADPRAARTDP